MFETRVEKEKRKKKQRISRSRYSTHLHISNRANNHFLEDYSSRLIDYLDYFPFKASIIEFKIIYLERTTLLKTSFSFSLPYRPN